MLSVMGLLAGISEVVEDTNRDGDGDGVGVEEREEGDARAGAKDR